MEPSHPIKYEPNCATKNQPPQDSLTPGATPFDYLITNQDCQRNADDGNGEQAPVFLDPGFSDKWFIRLFGGLFFSIFTHFIFLFRKTFLVKTEGRRCLCVAPC